MVLHFDQLMSVARYIKFYEKGVEVCSSNPFHGFFGLDVKGR